MKNLKKKRIAPLHHQRTVDRVGLCESLLYEGAELAPGLYVMEKL